MKIACHKSSDRACRVCEYRYVCDLSAYHKHDDVPGRKPLQVDSVLSATSDNPVSSRAVALAIEALRQTIGRWGDIGGNMDDQADLSARFGSIEELIGLLQNAVDVLKIPIPLYYITALLGHGSLQPVHTVVVLSENGYEDGVLKWTPVDGITVSQSRGSSVTNVNASYTNPPRLYKGHILAIKGASDKAISVVSIKCDSNYYGANLAIGTRLDGNGCVVDDPSKVSRELTSTSFGTHTFTVTGKFGEEVIYIQNNSDGNGTQLRPESISVTYLIPLDEDVAGYLNYEGLKETVRDLVGRIDSINNNVLFERGEMASDDLYAWYSNNEYRTEKAQYNLIGDYCMLSLVGVKTIAGWNIVYYSLPVSCVVPAHGFFKTQDGHNCYWAIASEPNTNVMVLRIASLDEGTALTQSAASLQICYKYK